MKTKQSERNAITTWAPCRAGPILTALSLAAQPRAEAQVFQELYSFATDTNGNSPAGALVQGIDGNFYGTTSAGGQPTTNDPAGGYGTVFKITLEGALTTIAWFDGNSGIANGQGPTNYGASPFGAMVQATDGNFYGMATGLFRVTPSGLLTGVDGGDVGDPIQGSDGCLYVADSYYESVYRFSLGGGPANYEWAIPGHPSGGLIQARDGNYYGLTSDGGTAYGTLYKLTPGGALTTVADFQQGPGAAVFPYGPLMQASDGNLYGVANGGISSCGTIFKATSDGALVRLASFSATNGESPNGPLLEANDGNFYGTTMEGGTTCCPGSIGTIFRMTPDGVITTLFSFTDQRGPYPGANPSEGLIQGSDGNLYGTCSSGGSRGGGNIFRILMPGPLLSAAQAGGQLLLSWRTNYVGYALQSSLDLANWSSCTNPPAIAGGLFVVTNPVSAGAGFFRLMK